MPIVDHRNVKMFELPGIKHQTIAGHKQGVRTMEVWMQTIAPGASTPMHRHACEEVVVILSGTGECTVAGKAFAFGPDTTLIIEPESVHQIVNTSAEEIRRVAALGMAPARVESAEGEPLPVPWDAP